MQDSYALLVFAAAAKAAVLALVAVRDAFKASRTSAVLETADAARDDCHERSRVIRKECERSFDDIQQVQIFIDCSPFDKSLQLMSDLKSAVRISATPETKAR